MTDVLKTIHETERFRFTFLPKSVEITTLDFSALIDPINGGEATLLSIAFKRAATHLDAIAARLAEEAKAKSKKGS